MSVPEEQQLNTGQILWNEDWLARQIWMAVFNTSNAYHGGPILSAEEWLPTWKDNLSERERAMWKAAARIAQTLFRRLMHVEIQRLQTEPAPEAPPCPGISWVHTGCGDEVRNQHCPGCGTAPRLTASEHATLAAARYRPTPGEAALLAILDRVCPPD